MSNTTGKKSLDIWTVYEKASDYPDCFVARRFENSTPTSDVLIADDLGDLQSILRERGLYRMDRMPDDDPVIVEVWL